MQAEVHFLHSGNGDTILIQGGEEWGLVDGNFVNAWGVRQEVETALQGVPRLRFVCITHLDLDHIRGLGRFLRERFSSVDAQGERTWHIGQVLLPLSPVSLRLLRVLRRYERIRGDAPGMKGDRLSQAAEQLLEALCDMLGPARGRGDARHPEFLCLSPGQDLLSRKDASSLTLGLGPWRCVCLGPMAETTDKFALLVRNSRERQQGVREVYEGLQNNAVSRVLALEHDATGVTVLLTGDSTRPELLATLREWRAHHLGRKQAAPPFVTVKVSHHGARSCHVPALYRNHCRAQRTRAIITALDRGDHPHPAVIAGFVRRGIDYRVTGSDAMRSSRAVPFRGTTVAASKIVLKVEEAGHGYSVGGRLSHCHPPGEGIS